MFLELSFEHSPHVCQGIGHAIKESYSAIKKKGLFLPVATWVNSPKVGLREKSQSPNNVLRGIILFIWKPNIMSVGYHSEGVYHQTVVSMGGKWIINRDRGHLTQLNPFRASRNGIFTASFSACS